MEVICEHCGVRLNLPDEKISTDKVVHLTCPKCKKKFPLDPRGKGARKVPSPRTGQEGGENDLLVSFAESKSASKNEEEGYSYKDYARDGELDFLEEGTKLALVLENNGEFFHKIKGALETLGYKSVSAPDTREATAKMRYYHFDFVLISDGFDGQQLEKSPILNYLNRISMPMRRRMFVALLGDRFRTMDNMISFALSANVTINKKDLDQLTYILKKAISEDEKFYKVLMDELKDLGKV